MDLEPIEETPEEEPHFYIWGDMADAIEDELGKEKVSPIAYYLKGTYCQLLYHQSDEDAFHLMKKAADMDYPPAQYSLAKMYEEGQGTSIDHRLYRHWLETSADNGHYEAEGEYDKILFYGKAIDKQPFFCYISRAMAK